ncbi:MAG: 2-oxoglutarate dehydrogenase complex dihydrolipoyllysine-residue succinyltransferase [Rhodospirillaceae bacterium]|nr:2-oxoglutarate dehydrogenase complex dihydrolipoyllysine-residue succinyltransferase [Rhodospirillaceae bacterium]
MATEIKVPALGESVSEATVAKWFKQPGDAVNADEPLVELETDKVTVEVPAPVSGALASIAATEGSDVEVGALLGIINEGAAGAKGETAPAEKAPAPAPAAKQPSAPAAPAAAPAASKPTSPTARKVMAEKGVDASTVQGTGPAGRITKADAVNASAGGKSKKSAATYPPRVDGPREERVPMTRLRKRIAERLKEAQDTAAMLTTFNEVDMGAVMEMRAKFKDKFEKRHGVKLGFMSFFAKACVTALREFPAVNAEIDGDDIIYKNYYDIGIAVGTGQGLVVPVVRNVDELNFAEIEQTINDYGTRAREGRLSMEELTGGTFTITNGGVFGSLLSTPILNPPQPGILGMHKIQQRPMVMADGSIEARPMMYLAMSYDHRIVDGREAVSFLVRVKECIENPERIMLDT